MKMTTKAPSGEGYFWWTNGGEHTPTILRVTRLYDGSGRLYASNGEYEFPFVPDSEEVYPEPDDEEDEPRFTHEGKDYYFGTCLWSKNPIELPEIDGEFVAPDSF